MYFTPFIILLQVESWHQYGVDWDGPLPGDDESAVVAPTMSTQLSGESTADREIFVVKNISSVPLTLKIEHAEYFIQIIRTHEIRIITQLCGESGAAFILLPTKSLREHTHSWR